jgi:hypothetical protein
VPRERTALLSAVAAPDKLDKPMQTVVEQAEVKRREPLRVVNKIDAS